MESRPKSSPPLSHLFFESVMNIKVESPKKPQINSKSASDIDHPSIRPMSRLSQDNHVESAPSCHTSVNVSHDSSEAVPKFSSASCKSSSSTSSTLQPHQYYPVPYEYYRILMEDARDRYAEASKFFNENCPYSFMYEFYTKILNDLLEELADTPSNIVEAAFTLCQQLRLLLLHLIRRRNMLLGHDGDEWKNEVISPPPPAGAEIYLEAAAGAKAARQRRCQMVVLIQTIADLKMKENACRQRRLQAEGELIRYVDKLRQSSDNDSSKMGDELESASEIAAGGNQTCENSDDEESLTTHQVPQDADEFNSSLSTQTRSDSSKNADPTGSIGNETHLNGAEQIRPDDPVSESSSADRQQTDSSNDRYCLLWMETCETEYSVANQKTPFIRLTPSSTCIFCGELHWSHLCLKMATLETRLRYLSDNGICIKWGTAHEGAGVGSVRACQWPQCRAINSHHSALCPNVEYPITTEMIQTYERKINDLNRIHKRPQVRKW